MITRAKTTASTVSFQFDEGRESVASEIRGLFEELQRRRRDSHNELRTVASVNVHCIPLC